MSQFLHCSTAHHLHFEKQLAEPEHLHELNHPVCPYLQSRCTSSLHRDTIHWLPTMPRNCGCWSKQCRSLYDLMDLHVVSLMLCCHTQHFEYQGPVNPPWAARHYTGLLIESTPKGVVFSFLFFPVNPQKQTISETVVHACRCGTMHCNSLQK